MRTTYHTLLKDLSCDKEEYVRQGTHCDFSYHHILCSPTSSLSECVISISEKKGSLRSDVLHMFVSNVPIVSNLYCEMQMHIAL